MDSLLSDVTVRVSQLGGHVLIDLVNTVVWGVDPHVDRLTDFNHDLVWARTVGLITAEEADAVAHLAVAEPQIAAAEHQKITAIRDNLHRALTGRRPPGLAVRAYREALTRAELVPDEHGWQWNDQAVALTTPRDRIARQVLGLFEHPRIDRCRTCDGEGCGWLFLDTSRRGDRRWCSPTDCGNRTRARRHYQRIRSEIAANTGPTDRL